MKVKNLDSLLTELSLDSEDSLLEYIQDGLKGAVDSVKDTLKVKDVRIWGTRWMEGGMGGGGGGAFCMLLCVCVCG